MYPEQAPDDAGKLLQQLAEHNPDIVWMFSPEWDELRFVDDAYEEVWGRSIESLREEPTDFLDGVHPEDREQVRAAMDRLSKEEPIEQEFRVNHQEAYQRHVWVQGEPVYENGEFVAVAGFVRDITERKRTREELERKNERLENFASFVSHDLRNPLTVAQGRLELAREECTSEHLDGVARSLNRMEDLVADLLTIAREGETGGDLEPVELAAVIDGCWRNVATDEATLVVETDIEIYANPPRLKQLLENLFRNAVEHGSTSPDSQAHQDAAEHGSTSPDSNTRQDAVEHTGGNPTVTVGEHADGFYIADDGPGIPEDERERIFQMGESSTPHGTGLGLSIVREVADAHGWEVTVGESDAGGARFDILGVERPE